MAHLRGDQVTSWLSLLQRVLPQLTTCICVKKHWAANVGMPDKSLRVRIERASAFGAQWHKSLEKL